MDELYLSPPGQAPEAPLELADKAAPSMPPNPPVARERSSKANIGIGKTLNIPPEKVTSDITQGREDELRKQASSELNYRASMKRHQNIIDLANKKGAPLSLDEVQRVSNPFNSDYESKPDDVIEKAYAHEYISSANTADEYMQNTVLRDARLDIPDESKEVERKGSKMLGRVEFARTLQQNVQTDISKQGWVPFLWDQAKTMVQPYNEYMMRGVDPETGKIEGGILLGDNMKSQADNIFNAKTDEEYKKRLTDAVTSLKSNPTLQSQFLDFVVGTSADDRILNNVFTLIAPTDLAAGFSASKSLVRKVDTYNRVNKAFKDIVKSSEHVGKDVPTKAVMEEGAGAVDKAGVTRAADSTAQELQGSLDPVTNVKDKLTSNFKLDGDILDNNPGTLSREQLTRLKDAFYSAGSNILDTLTTALRVNRTPIPLASEEAFEAYKASAKSKLRGEPGDALLDIGSYRHEPITNTYHIPFTFGTPDGGLYSNVETAVNAAKRMGFTDVRVSSEGEGAFKYYVPKSAIVNDMGKGNTSFGYKIINGEPKFYSDINNDVQVAHTTKPAPGWIPVTLEDAPKEAGGKKAVFGQTLDANAVHVEQQGLGYKFTVWKPYNETDAAVRNFLIDSKTTEGKTKYFGKGASSSSQEGFESWKNAALGWIRGADDTLSYNETLQRKVATYTQSLVQKWANEEAKYLEQISTGVIKNDPVTGNPIPTWLNRPRSWAGKFTGNRKMFKEFNEVLDYARKADDPITGERGYFFKTPGEIEDHYQRYYQRLPTFPEVQGYFAHVRLVEGNRVLSEVAEFRNRARLGTEQHQISVQGLAKDQKQSGYFDGLAHDTFPGGEGQILVMGDQIGQERLYNLGANNIPPADLARYRKEVLEGKVKVIEVFDPDSHPLQNFSDVAGSNRVRYVMSYNTEAKPLDFNHVNRRGGGHFDYDSDFYVKQAKVIVESMGGADTDKRNTFKNTYIGDNTFMPISNRAMGKDVVNKMNDMRLAIKAGDTAKAENISKSLGIEWKESQEWFKPQRNKEGKILPPRIDVNEPFYVVPRNKKIYDLDKSLENRYRYTNEHGIEVDTFKDGTKSGSLAQQFQVAHNIERDAAGMQTVENVGTQGNPIYKWVDSKMVDPIPTMNRSLNRAISSTFMDDYKINAVEHWLTEAADHMKADISEIRAAPFYHFNNPDFKSGVEKNVEWNLRSNHMKIKQFLGTPNKFDTWVHGVTQDLADKFYTKFGPEDQRTAFGKAVTIIPLWALGNAADPISKIRSFAFNAKLGVFSIPQFLVQAQNFTTILALDPKRAIAGTYAVMLHQWARVAGEEAMLKSLDNYAGKIGIGESKWKAGEWMEARKELARSGFEHVGGEYQLADDALQHKFIKNDWNNFLDAGQVFFREGEKASRLGAWYTAFREFRDINPTKVLTDADRAQILNKADLLTTNMSRASSSTLHGGVLGLSTQFLSYQIRMAELFFGKRIGETMTDRVLARGRLLSVYGAMYGAPSAIGITGWPFGDSIRQEAINRGYVVGDNYITSLLMEGVPAWTMAMATGGGDSKKGNWYNVGDRYGSQGFTQLKEAMRSDGSIWKIIGGAGVSSIANTFAAADPFWQAAKALVSDDEEGNTFKIKPMDLVKGFSEVSSVDAMTRFIYAMNTGKWVSKNEAYIDDVSKSNAAFMAILTGLKPQGQDDIFSLKEIKDGEEAVQKAAVKSITRDYRRGIQAASDNDPETAKDYFIRSRRQMVQAGIPLDKRTEIMANASRGYEKMINSSQWNWATKNVPYGEERTRSDAITRQLQLNNNRTQ